MHTHTCLRRMGAPIKTICILLVAIFLVGVLQFIVTGIWWEFAKARNPLKTIIAEFNELEKQQMEIYNAIKAFAPDGTVYLVSNTPIPGTRQTKYIVKNQDNKVLFEGSEKDNPYEFIQWSPTNRHGYRNIDQKYLNELNLIGGEFSRTFAIPLVNDNNERIGHWFFDIDKRIFKYYSISGEQAGYIGINGYTENRSDAGSFNTCEQMISWLRPNSYDPMTIYRTENTVYQIDFENKKVEILVKTDKDPIRSIALTNWQETEEYGYRPSLAIITNSNK